MPKTGRFDGPSNGTFPQERHFIDRFPADVGIEGDLILDGNLYVRGVSSTGPAASTEIAYAQITANTAVITIDTFNLDVIPGLAITIPSLAVPVYIRAQAIASHNVASPTISLGIGLSSATLITNCIGIGNTVLGPVGTSGTMIAFARIAPASPGTYQAFVLGDAGNVTIKAAAYFPAFIHATTV